MACLAASRRRTNRLLLALFGSYLSSAAFAEDAPVPVPAGDASVAEPDAPARPTAEPTTDTQPAPPAAPHRTIDINAYDVEGNTLLDQLAVETAVYPHLGPGKTPDDVEAARAALEHAYQARGYQSVIVQVPAQNAQSGIVRLRVTEAKVGRVRVVGAEFHAPSAVREQMPSVQEGQVPDFRAVQRDLADVNRLPDRRVSPSLKPGRIPGTVDVDLRVNDNLPLHASVELNNDHSQNTKPLRSTATVRYDNLWQLGHSLSATYSVAPQQPSNSQVFAGSYRAPLWGTPWSALAYGYTSNNAVATLGGTNVLGKGHTLGLRGIYQLPPLGGITQSINFGIDYKHFDQNLTLGTASIETPITYFPLSAVYSLQYATDHSTTSGAVTVTAGLRGAGSSTAVFEQNRAFAESDFVVLKVDADHTETFAGGASATARFAGQIADKPLVSSEQFSAGGNTSVRGYLQSEAVADDGMVGSIEVQTQSFARYSYGLLDDWRFYGFADAGQLWVLDAQAEQQSNFTLYSIGLGTRFALLDYLHGDFALAMPMRTGSATDRSNPQAIFTLRAEM